MSKLTKKLWGIVFISMFTVSTGGILYLTGYEGLPYVMGLIAGEGLFLRIE